MRARRTVLAVVVCLLAAVQLDAQTVSTSSASSASTQAAAALNNALAALSHSAVVTDVIISGTAEWITGSDNETGTVTYRALSAASRMDLNLSNGARTEIRSTDANGLSGSWIGSDGVSHPFAYHNLFTDTGLFPLFMLGNFNSSTATVLTYLGVETHDGATVIHLSASQRPTKSSKIALEQHLSQVDIYLDPSTNLPLAYVYNAHPDDNALADIPVEIRYSNYQTVSGLQVPFHVQRFINNNLQLDLQFQSASVNTGITATQISAQ